MHSVSTPVTSGVQCPLHRRTSCSRDRCRA
jgi:hypothetical protein